MKRKRKMPVRRLLRILPAAAAIAAVTAFLCVDAALRAPVADIARERITNAASSALTGAAGDRSMGLDPDLLSEIKRTGDGSFVIRVDTALLNSAAADISREAQRRIEKLGEYGAEVELGTASGITLLSGKGPKVRVSFAPSGSVTTKLSSHLKSAGINQSLFSIELTLTAQVRMILAGHDELITVKNTVPICETAIVGEAPQVYTNVANEEDMLNLVPTELP